MKTDNLAILLASLSFIIAIVMLWQFINVKRRNYINSGIVNKQLKRISNASYQQYYYFKEHMLEFIKIIDTLMQQIKISGQQKLFKNLIEFREKTIIGLRKMEVASSYSGTQKEALMFFAGSKHGKLDHVIEYIRFLYDDGLIDNDNIRLALRIISNTLK